MRITPRVCTSVLSFQLVFNTVLGIINPRRTCAERVTVVVSCVCVSVCLSVCLYVCLSEHAILAVHAIRSITNDAIVLSVRFAAILKRRVFLKIVLFES